MNKLFPSAAKALEGVVADGQLLAVGGFGLCGVPSVLIGALLMALLTLGGEALQISMSLPQSVSLLFQGLLLMFLLSADVLVNYRVVWRK